MIAHSALPGSLMVRSRQASVVAILRYQRAVAAVARRDDDDDARFDQAVDLHAERAVAAGEPLRIERIAEAEVDAVDFKLAPVVIDQLYVRDGRDDVARIPMPNSSSTFRLTSWHLGAMPLTVSSGMLLRVSFACRSPVRAHFAELAPEHTLSGLAPSSATARRR